MKGAAPLDPMTCAYLDIWAEVQPPTARVSLSTFRSVLATTLDLRRQLREARAERDTAWAILEADLNAPSPDSETI